MLSSSLRAMERGDCLTKAVDDGAKRKEKKKVYEEQTLTDQDERKSNNKRTCESICRSKEGKSNYGRNGRHSGDVKCFCS